MHYESTDWIEQYDTIDPQICGNFCLPLFEKNAVERINLHCFKWAFETN